MKATVTKENFKKTLSLVGHIVSTSSTLPILSNILLQSDNGRLKISATNLEIGLTCWFGGKVDKDGKVTLPAKTISDYVATTIGDKIDIETTNGVINFSTSSSKANIKTLPTDDFPLIPQIEPSGKIKISALELKKILSEVYFSAAPIETQPELSGIYVYLEEENIFFVATDRFRLSEKSYKLEKGKIEGEFNPIIIPQKTIQEAIRLLASLEKEDEEVEIIQGENQVLFKMSDIEMVSRLVDGEFPDYRQIVPKNFESEAKVSRYELLQAVKSAGVFAATGRSVKITFKPGKALEVFAASGDIGDSKVEIVGEVEGKEQSGIFNFKYLIDFLNSISNEKVIIKSFNENSPTIISPADNNDSLYLVMPIKQ